MSLVVCGSYRRGKAASGDIDVLITAEGCDVLTCDVPKKPDEVERAVSA